MKSAATFFRILVQPLTIGLVVALVVRATLLQAYSIPSGSMSPTLEPGDHILVTPIRGWVGSREVSRGEVVVFRNPEAGPGYFVKRVIGIPGDYVEVRQGQVRVNGRVLDEPYVAGGTTPGRLGELVPSGHLFVMGDHRADSIDSRTWGFLPADRVVGRARLIFWSSGRGTGSAALAQASGGLEEGEAAPRWERILRPIR